MSGEPVYMYTQVNCFTCLLIERYTCTNIRCFDCAVVTKYGVGPSLLMCDIPWPFKELLCTKYIRNLRDE